MELQGLSELLSVLSIALWSYAGLETMDLCCILKCGFEMGDFFVPDFFTNTVLG